jgi:hypothetical protein
MITDAEKKGMHPPEIELPDVATRIFQTLLKCMYSDTSDITPHTVTEVLTVAKKYEVQALVETCNRYIQKGITEANAFDMLQLSEAAALRFVERNAQALFQQDAFLKLPKDKVRQLLESDALSIDEVDLFKAVLRWGEEYLYRHKQELGLQENEKGLQTVLAELIPLIRFPVMSMEDFSSEVVPTHVLQSDQQLEIFQYIAAGEKAEEMKLSCSFIFHPRGGDCVQWELSTMPNEVSSEDDVDDTIFTSSSYSWRTILGIPIRDGASVRHEIVLEKYNTQNSLNVVIGFVPMSFPQDSGAAQLKDLSVAHGYNKTSGWCYVTGTGKSHNKSLVGELIGSPASQGDRIALVLRLYRNGKQGTIELFVNGVSKGIPQCWRNVVGPVRPALSFISQQTVRSVRKPKSK